MFGNRMYAFNVGLLILAICGALLGVAGFVAGFMSETSGVSLVKDEDSQDKPESAPYERGDQRDEESPPDVDSAHPTTPLSLPAPDDDLLKNRPKPTKPRKPNSGSPDDTGNASISGTVFDKRGNPLPSVPVSAIRANFSAAYPQNMGDSKGYQDQLTRYFDDMQRQTRVATSDKDGRFQFDGLDSMLAYNLSVREAGIGTGYAYNVAAGDNSDIFISSSLIPVNGRLVCPSGSLPASFTIQGFDATAQYRYAMVTEQFSSKDGTFTIMVSKAGEWIFTATAQGFYQSEERSITVAETGGEVELPLTEGARLNGRVLSTGNNEPLPNINITLHWPAGIQDKDAQKSKASSRNASTSFGESSGEIMMSGFGGRYSTSSSSKTNGGQAAYASTDSLGRFSFDSLEPGTYTLRAVVGQKTIEEGITLGTGETKHDVFVDIGAILAITVTAQSNEPILQPRVSLSVLNDQGEPQSGIGVSQLDSAPGRLRYAGIEPGKYRVTVQAEGYAPAYQDVTLAAGDNPLAFTLEQGCFVRGIVTMSDGSAIPQQMYVRVTDPNAPPQGRNGSNQNIVGINGTEGRFNLGPLSPGVKTIEVVSYQYSRSDPNDPYRSRFKTTLTLVAGDNLCDMSVEPGCLLTITVFDEAGNVIRNAIDVRPLDMNTAAMYSGSCRGPGQPAVIEVLDAGRYSVTANGGGSNLLASTIEVYAHQGINDISVTLFAGNCVRITQVMDNSQAKAAGLQVGDLIVTYNGQNVTSINDLSTFRKQVPDNQPASVVVDRNGAILTFDIKGGYIGVNGESARR